MALLGEYAHVWERLKWHHPTTQSLVSELCSLHSAVTPLSFVSGFHPLPFYTVHDQVIKLPSGTCLLSFISDVAAFPNPLILSNCGFAPFCNCPTLQLQRLCLCRRFSPSNGQVRAAPRNASGTVLLQCLETVVGCHPAPEKVHAIL